MLISTLLYLSIGRPRGGNHAELDVLVRAFAMSCRYSGSLGKCVTSMLEAGAEHSCLRYVTRYKVPAVMIVGSKIPAQPCPEVPSLNTRHTHHSVLISQAAFVNGKKLEWKPTTKGRIDAGGAICYDCD